MIYLKKFIGIEATRNASLRVRKFVAIATPRSRSDDAERVVGKPEGIWLHSGISLAVGFWEATPLTLIS
jgi:hypothetical protein